MAEKCLLVVIGCVLRNAGTDLKDEHLFYMLGPNPNLMFRPDWDPIHQNNIEFIRKSWSSRGIFNPIHNF